MGTRVSVRLRKGQGTVDVRASLFCTIRDSSDQPLCDFYAAAVSRLFDLYGVPAEVRLGPCLASGGASCLIGVTLGKPAASASVGPRASRMKVTMRSAGCLIVCAVLLASPVVAQVPPRERVLAVPFENTERDAKLSWVVGSRGDPARRRPGRRSASA